ARAHGRPAGASGRAQPALRALARAPHAARGQARRVPARRDAARGHRPPQGRRREARAPRAARAHAGRVRVRLAGLLLRAQALHRGHPRAAQRRRARPVRDALRLGAALFRRGDGGREGQAQRDREHRLRHDGRLRRGVGLRRALLRGRLPERGRHAGGVGRPPVHLLDGGGLRAVPRRRRGRARHRRARRRHARRPAARALRRARARRADPAAPALSGAQRGAVHRGRPGEGMRILVVVQRYGADVTGGSEGHARTTAVRLSRRHTVEVATTTAQDYWTWANHDPSGDDTLDGLAVHRFPVAAGRREDFKDVERHVLMEPHTLADEQEWLRAQGPHAPALLDFLHERGREYDAVLFYTYIYEPTAAGLPIVPERAALISTAHDEAALGLAPYRALFQ